MLTGAVDGPGVGALASGGDLMGEARRALLSGALCAVEMTGVGDGGAVEVHSGGVTPVAPPGPYAAVRWRQIFWAWP